MTSADNVLPSSDEKSMPISCGELPSPCTGNHENVVLDNCIGVTSTVAMSIVHNSITDVRMAAPIYSLGMHITACIPGI